MGTGWTTRSTRCGHCNGQPDRMARCTCTGQPPGAAVAGGGAPAFSASIEAALAAGRIDPPPTREERFSISLAERGFRTHRRDGTDALEVPLNDGWLAYVNHRDMGARSTEIQLIHPRSGEHYKLKVLSPTPDRLADTLESFQDPTPKGPAPSGVPASVWEMAGPAEFRTGHDPDRPYATALWTTVDGAGDWANRGALIHQWIGQHADTVPRESLIELANRHLMAANYAVSPDAGLFRCRNKEYVGETTIADEGEVAFFSVVAPDPDDPEDDWSVEVQSVRASELTRYRETTFPPGEIVEYTPQF